jgi:spore coat polysaccharide biosynthesis predicted glycosyltransferase SpsG
MRIVFVTIASAAIGYGHLKRCENIGSYLKKKNFVVRYKIFNEIIKKKKVVQNRLIYPINSIADILTEKTFCNSDFIFFDISNKKVFKKIDCLREISKKFQKKIIIFDSLGKDMLNKLNLLNYSKAIYPYFFDHKKIKKKKNVKYFFGAKYLPLPLEYKNINFKIKNYKKISILISCGGSDVNINTIKILNFLNQFSSLINIKIIVVVGPYFSKKNIDMIINYKKKNKSLLDLKLVFSPNNFSKFILKSNLAIISSGLTKYEIASVGMPAIVFCENKEQLKMHKFFAKKNITVNLGLINNLKFFEYKFLSLVKNMKKIKILSRKSKKLFSYDGKNEILKLMKN